jgi:ATP-dependent RNA circularization protein (DNA/RNA ligase family)
MIWSYPSIYTLGHPAVAELFDGPVSITEKVDGSQFSFGIIEGELQMRSKGAQIYAGTTDKLFGPAAATAQELADAGLLMPGAVYRCEALRSPKHNTLCYGRIPEGHIYLYDVELEPNVFMAASALVDVARQFQVEPVRVLGSATFESAEGIRELLDTESCLGGCKVEGVVVKNYARFGRDKKVLMGKYVSEAFKEKHSTDWKKANPSGKDIREEIGESYKVEARWRKAVQHRAEAGLLEHSPRDIGPLLKELGQDVRGEEEEQIKELLWKWAWPTIQRKLSAGFPDWYKQQLLERQFDSEPVS